MNRVRGSIAIIAASAPLALGSLVLATPAQAAPPHPPRLATVGGVDAVKGVGNTVGSLGGMVGGIGGTVGGVGGMLGGGKPS